MVIGVVADFFVLANDRSYQYLRLALKDAGFNPDNCLYLPAFSEDDDKRTPESLAAWREEYVDPVIKKHGVTHILGMGNNALCVLGFEKKPARVNAYRSKALVHTSNAVTCMTISPSAVMREPSNETSFRYDIAFAKRCFEEGGEFRHEIPVHIVDIETPEQVQELWQEAIEHGYCAYDHETTGVRRDDDLVVSNSYCTGVKIDGSYKVWFWGGYDKLVPRFDAETLERFRVAFREFYEGADADVYTMFDPVPKNKFRFIAWNKGFDDWMSETWLIGPPEARYDCPLMRTKQITLPGSMYDAMYLKWTDNNERPHDLKTAVEVIGGYPNYDELINTRVSETSKRRGKVLSHPDDFATLEWMGKKPEISSKKGDKISYRWPKNVDKKACAYAMIDYEELRLYNARDAAGTFLVWEILMDRIQKAGLEVSCMLRHVAHNRCIRAEQRGTLLDVEFNRKASKQLGTYIQQTKDSLDALLLAHEEFVPLVMRKPKDKKDKGGFNPGSNDQIIKILYGDLGSIPVIMRKPLYRRYSEESVEELAEAIESEVYGDYVETKAMLRNGTFDSIGAMDQMQKLWSEATHDGTVIMFAEKLVGLGGLMYDPPTLTKKGNPSVSRASMLTLIQQKPNDILDLILMYNKSVKIKSSFIDKIYESRDKWNLVRTSINPHGTQSGRLSSSGNYNTQNLPKKLRGMFIARPGMIFVGLDYKSAEVFTLAAYSDDPNLLEAIYASDTHRFVASFIYDKPEDEITDDERQAGKMSVFLIVYGGGADKLAQALSIPKSKAQWIIDMLLAKFPGIKTFIVSAVEAASVDPYYAYTAFGTRRSTKDILSSDMKIKSHVQRYAANHSIQGSAGEMCVYKIDRICEESMDVGWSVWFVNTVHDSKLYETWDGEEAGYVWLVPVEYFDKEEKKNKIKMVPRGKMVDLMYQIVSEKVPFPPLDKVEYRCDLDAGYAWDGKPDLDGALNDKRKGGFRFELLPKMEDVYDDGEEMDDDGIEVAVLT
jgi:hypothetical protein